MNMMDMMGGMNPATGWAILGVILLIAEIMLTTSFIIPFALSAFLVTALVLLRLLPMGLLWQGLAFAVMGVCLIPVCRRLLLKFSRSPPDINRY